MSDDAPLHREPDYQDVLDWVNTRTWKADDVAEHVADSIIASGSDDEDVWVMFVNAGEMAEAQAELEEARTRRDEQIRLLRAKGIRAHRIAHWLDISQARIGQILAQGDTHGDERA